MLPIATVVVVIETRVVDGSSDGAIAVVILSVLLNLRVHALNKIG